MLTFDDALGDLARGDVLVVGGRIADVGRNIQHSDAEVIDAAGTVVKPGFVDTHQE